MNIIFKYNLKYSNFVEALKTVVLKEKCLLWGGYNGVECVYPSNAG